MLYGDVICFRLYPFSFLCAPWLFQVEKYRNMAQEQMELGKALVRASDKAARPAGNPKAKAKAKAAPAGKKTSAEA